MAEVLGSTQVVGVIGWPVRHSFSPPMQNAALEALGLDWVYVPLPVAPDDLPAALAGLRASGLVGFNATIPHKEALLELVDLPTETARLTGTVNTVHFTPQGIVGDSTDGPGLIAALAADGCPVAGRRVVLLGAGGSARAVAVALALAGVERIVIANRTLARAQALADLLRRSVGFASAAALALPSPELVSELRAASLILNTTSVGLHPAVDECPVELPELAAGAWLVDLIYNPPQTRLMAQAASRGATVRNGTGLLAHQGALSLERWTGQPAPAALMLAVLRAELARRLG